MSSTSAAGRQFATTVFIPVKNGGALLKDCLDAVAAQRTSFPFEVLCIDSGSSDDSLEIIKQFGRARLYQIAPNEFGHGKTRNLALSLSQTPFVALITQDAIPADDRWLEELIRPFRFDDNLAGVFGKHLPHLDCRPAESYMLERHFAQFGAKEFSVRIGANPKTWTEYADHRDLYCFFSDNNAAVRKSVWELIPYPDVEFMEDQLWAGKVLEAGYAKAWAPDAAVRHSHNYGAVTTMRRAFDESRFRRLYQDPHRSWSLRKWLEHARTAGNRDADRMLELTPQQWWRQVPGTFVRHHAEALGRYLGDNSPFLPRAVVNRISQHVSLRGTPEEDSGSSIANDFERYVRGSYAARGIIDGTADVTHQLIHLWRTSRQTNASEALLSWRRQLRKAPTIDGWWNASVYRFLDQRPAPLLTDRSTIRSEGLTLNWVIPPFGEGGGGHLNIFRMIHLLEKRGIHSRVYVLDGDAAMPYPSAQLRALVHGWFAPIEAPVEALRDAMLPADFAIATHWSSAYAVRALGNARVQAYFVQDYEPLFYPAGSEAVLADATYRFGFRGIAAGAWLGAMLRDKYKMTVCDFPLAVDHDLYWPEPTPRPGGHKSVFAYFRPQTPRRAFELVALALRKVKQLRPDVEIHAAGSHLTQSMLPFHFHGHGILSGEQLRKLYSNMTVGIAPSLSNYSLLPQEMAACGCPVIDVDVESARAVYPPGAVVLAEPSVEGLIEQTLKLLDDGVFHRQQVRRGLRYAQSLTWEDAADSIHQALQSWVRRSPPVLASPAAARRQRRTNG